jgi:hypothetical protein
MKTCVSRGQDPRINHGIRRGQWQISPPEAFPEEVHPAAGLNML